MEYIIKSAKTVDDAINEALLELGTEREDVEVEIIDEGSKGFLGLIGGRDAEVKVTKVKKIEELAKEFLEKIVESMSLKASVKTKRENNNLIIDVVGINPKNKGIIIGKRGKTLDAIQYLLSIYVNKEEEEYIKVIMDIEGYRKKRKKSLVRLAKRMANKSLSSGRKVKLEPMNPYERRIIHSTLQNFEGVETFSEGEDPYRRVVIKS